MLTKIDKELRIDIDRIVMIKLCRDFDDSPYETEIWVEKGDELEKLYLLPSYYELIDKLLDEREIQKAVDNYPQALYPHFDCPHCRGRTLFAGRGDIGAKTIING